MASRESTLSAARMTWESVGELFLIFVIFFLYGASFPPDVNEAHYLAKAKHFWNPEWCRGDLFLESADAHFVFYYTFGWLTKFLSLPTTAWVGRILTWLGLAISWCWMCRAVVPYRGAAALSAGLFLLFLRWFAAGGEWVVGGVEAKGFSYIFLFLSLGAFARGYWTWAWLAAGAAAAFHILVGGWLMIGLAGTWLVTKESRPAWSSMFLAGCGAVLLSLPSLIPALALSSGVDRETVREANRIYVYERLGHHLLFHRFNHIAIAAQIGLGIAWLSLYWKFPWPEQMRRLQRVVGAALLIAVAGAIIDQTTLYHQDLAAALLRYYWFRMSDALLPVGMALFLVAGAARLTELKSRWASTAVIALLLVSALNLADVCRLRSANQFPPGIVAPRASGRPTARLFSASSELSPDEASTPPEMVEQQKRLLRLHGEITPPSLDAIAKDWLQVCAWIADNTETDAKFLTPRAQQSFKWYAQRAEVVSWKDTPQDARGLTNWFETWNEIHPDENAPFDLSGFDDNQLGELASKQHASYLLIDRTRSQRPISFPRLYPENSQDESWFEVYRVLPRTGRPGLK